MKYLLMPNLRKKDGKSCMNRTVRTLSRLGDQILLEQCFRSHIEEPDLCVFGDADELLPACDMLMPIGGDGTILRAVHKAVRADKPVIGINTGRVGFLTQIEARDLSMLEQLGCGEYRIEERMLLELESVGNNPKRLLALNDLVIKHEAHKLTEIGVYAGERLIEQPRADGVIFSTPTGSTGYALSAGGVIVDPLLELIQLTPVNPYILSSHPLILPADVVYKVVLYGKGGGRLDVLADGDLAMKVSTGAELHIRRAEKNAKLVDLGHKDFYENLRKKVIYRR